MQCGFCARGFTKSEEKRRVEERRQPDGSVRVFGDELPDKLAAASGPLVSVLHSKCWHARESRRQLQSAQAADPSARDDRVTDYRDQETCEVGQIREGYGDYRGPGAPRQ